MVWQPAGYDGNLQYFGRSNDEIPEKIYGTQKVSPTRYDFIIVGAGTAGCVVANRLTEKLNWKVLLLENGDEEPLVTEVPELQRFVFDSSIDYAYSTNDTKLEVYRRGKVMGGSSSINGQVYARGSKADYDDWAKRGNKGWSWKNVLPYFKKSENARTPAILANYSQYHGVGGYLTVEQFPMENENISTFINAFEEAGLKETDYNKGDQIGVGRMQFTNVHGFRISSNGAFIRPIRGKRSNLFIRPNARVTKIIIGKKTKRAIGVEYEINDNGKVVKKQVFAKKEVIVSGGFIESPKLLMLSGIGPKEDLQQLNITVIKDLPVGLNLRDHFTVPMTLVSPYNDSSIESDEQIKSDLFEWFNTHEGLLSSKGFLTIEAYYQTKYENKSGAADIQYELRGGKIGKPLGNVTIYTVLVAPRTNGSITLNKVDPIRTQPDIRMNYLADERDVEVLIEGLKFTKKLANTTTLKNLGFKLSTERVSGCKNFEFESDDYLRCFVKREVLHWGHGTGTCKMGPRSDSTTVVDPQLRVHGIKGLRVIDASIMPQVPRANTMAPTIMIGEKGSDMIKSYWL
ncbi:glucose dehydrogenase [FAD, quinone]-like [Phymastichus coffea]|uniref:glucose dehydrogenase [FAD, quinone]-like n=1 Tax=Phymastichus coffea TaxID=108790 RepID=UPI00273CA5B9|nr:glucose dehydrogenase [FAD, quinone]-like [Phymastichus coffea]